MIFSHKYKKLLFCIQMSLQIFPKELKKKVPQKISKSESESVSSASLKKAICINT